jgi:predicted RNA-binding Zn-ribbon protein involved in translation (DUF1610 family)
MSITKVYKYGLLPPTMGAQEVRDQLHLAHKYRNDLTKCVRNVRDAERLAEPASLKTLMNQMALAEQKCEDLAQAIKATRQKVGSAATKAKRDPKNRAESEQAREDLRVAREDLRTIRAQVKAERTVLKPALKVSRDLIHEQWLADRRALRATYSQHGAGLRHGSYCLVENALDDSVQDLKGLWDGSEPNDPRFRRWTGEGSIGVQICGGVTIPKLGTNTFLQVDPFPNLNAGPSAARRAVSGIVPKCASKWARLRMRIGTDVANKRAPVWAEWPMILHRPLPTGAVIKDASVSVRKRGHRERWTAQLTVQMPDGWRHEPCGNGVVGVDLNFRQLGHEVVSIRREDGSFLAVEVPVLRAAWWHGEDGKNGEVRLPGKFIARMMYCEKLRSIRDERQDAMKDTVREWAKPASAAGQLPADWFPTLGQLAAWRAPEKWMRLHREWRDKRIPGDDVPFTALAQWVEKERHLHEWESFQRTSAIRWRKDLYRKVGVMLARSYGVLALENMQWNEIARKGLIQEPGRTVTAEDDGSDLHATARRNRFLVAPGDLAECLREAMTSRLGQNEKVDAAGTTDMCSSCGTVGNPAASEVKWQCAQCGVIHDRDQNAAVNICRRGRERLNGAGNPGPARQTEGGESTEQTETRRAKIARMRAEKVARMDAARKAGAI